MNLVAKRRIAEVDGHAAVLASAVGVAGLGAAGTEAATDSAGLGIADPAVRAVPRETLATAVRYLLQVLAEREPGNTLEVRVPPFGAVQCVEGPKHTRGTPPNVIEMPAQTWLALAAGQLSWKDGLESGAIQASGTRADLSPYLPILPG